MDVSTRISALLVSLIALTSGSLPSQQTYSPQLLAALDPSMQAARICGGKQQGQSIRDRLAAAAQAVGSDAQGNTRLYEGLGRVHLPITTASPLAQRYFDQGLSFAYGFNHAAAIASFRAAQRLDPGCAMCLWGEALAHGPNINAPMDPMVNARAVSLSQQAAALSDRAGPAERELIAAMLLRYSADPSADRLALDAAYADAMLGTARANPANDDIALLAAEAAMDTKPWDYWLPDRQTAQPRIGEAVSLVERVFARNPEHPQAAHLYVHLMENGPDPKRAEAAADRLATPLAPDSGHLVHMPAHIYYRLGRWQDSLRVNLAAARADESWIAETGDKGLVRYGYYPHNVHFIVTSAQMAGDMATAIREARKLEATLDPETSSKIAWIQAIHAAPYFAAAQFAKPKQVLAMDAPDARLPYPKAMRHYARALARASQRNRTGFEAELSELRALRESGDFKTMIEQGVPAPDLLLLAETVARARWAYASREFGESARLYREAIAIEGRIPYMEPPYWYYPVHQSLGAALYRAGRHDEARNAFMAALVQSPNNGWALYGLAQAERALGRKQHAAAAQASLKRAWLGDAKWLRMDRL